MKRLRWTVAMVAAAALLSGCGEVTNTLTPKPGTANTVTVALDSPPNFTQVGIYEAEVRGDLRQTDEDVRFVVATSPLADLQDGRAQIAIMSEPAVLAARNRHIALASVAAILQGPQHVILHCQTGKSSPGAKGGATSTTASSTTAATRTRHTASAVTTTQTTATTTSRSHPPLRTSHARGCTATIDSTPFAQFERAPTYNALDFVVTENEIINHAPIIRRFVQAVARGYAAVRTDPEQATQDMVSLFPTLSYPEELAGVQASIANFFPSGSAVNRPWGWQTVKDWNAFGSWLLDHHIISNVNATPDADTNELLAGQGV